MKKDWVFLLKGRDDVALVISANGLFEAMNTLVLLMGDASNWELKP